MSVTAVPLHPIRKGSVVRLWIGLLLLVLAAAGLAWLGTRDFQPQTLKSGVGLRTVKPGTGAKITPADVVALNYRLHAKSLESPVIQDSKETGQPFVTTTQGIYPGFAEGLQRMSPGGSYVLTLPGGSHEQGPMPPGAPFKASDALVFEIDVLQVERGAAERFLEMQQMQRMQQMQQMQQLQQQGSGGSGAAGGAGAAERRPPPS